MAETGWLIDKSARLEVGYSALTAAQACSVFRTPPISMMPVKSFTPAIEDRALEVQLLVGSGAGRGWMALTPPRLGPHGDTDPPVAHAGDLSPVEPELRHQ